MIRLAATNIADCAEIWLVALIVASLCDETETDVLASMLIWRVSILRGDTFRSVVALIETAADSAPRIDLVTSSVDVADADTERDRVTWFAAVTVDAEPTEIARDRMRFATADTDDIDEILADRLVPASDTADTVDEAETFTERVI